MPVSPSLILDKVPFLAFLNKERGMEIYIHTQDVPLVTVILTTYWFEV